MSSRPDLDRNLPQVGGSTVLVTGSSGSAGTILAPRLARRYHLRLADVRPPSAKVAAEVLTADLTDPVQLVNALTGVETVIHLAGNPDYTAAWRAVSDANVGLTEQVLRAALAAGVRRVVVASSVHAMGGYIRDGDVPVDAAWPTRACCLYGASKVAAEVISEVYARRHGLSVICLRLGWMIDRPYRPIGLDVWLSPRDLADLVTGAIEADVRWGTYFGISANTRGRWRTDTATRDLRYSPVDDAERFASELARADAYEGDDLECFPLPA